MNLIDVAKKFATEESCVKYLAEMRWPEGVRCLKCESPEVSFMATKSKANRKGEQKTRYIYQCRSCQHQFTPTTGTLFHDTHLDLEKWFHAVALMCNAKKGVSALQMKRDLKTAYKTAWYLNHRIRQAMELVEEATQEPLTGIVEADETFIGGRYDKRRKRARCDKEPVFGVVQRDGKARTYHMPEPTMKKIVDKIKGDVSINADGIYTDDGKFYGTTAGCIKNHNHQRVHHIAKEWVRGDVHTGTIDGYWSLLKRGIVGSFHQISIKHLHRYLSEFQFRWNNREAEDMFALVIVALVIGIALPYAELIGKISEQASDSSEDVPF